MVCEEKPDGISSAVSVTYIVIKFMLAISSDSDHHTNNAETRVRIVIKVWLPTKLQNCYSEKILFVLQNLYGPILIHTSKFPHSSLHLCWIVLGECPHLAAKQTVLSMNVPHNQGTERRSRNILFLSVPGLDLIRQLPNFY